MYTKFNQFLQWVMLSSANPKEVSLSVRMFTLGLVPYILSLVTAACGFGLVCLGVEADSLNTLAQMLGDIVFWSLSIVSGIGFVIGLVRKLVLTAKGNNKVVATWSD